MYNKTIIRLGFCDIRDISLRLRLITLTETLIIPDITKTSSNTRLILNYLFIVLYKNLSVAITVFSLLSL